MGEIVLSDVEVYLVVREENSQIRVCRCIVVKPSVETVLYYLVVLMALGFGNDFPVGEIVIWRI